MAQIFPTIENIKRLKEKPRDGELFIVNYLVENLDDDFEIYFQPFLGISRPDVIIMKKGCGVAVIEVKDWKPRKYLLDENNTWRLTKNNQPVPSPYQQVFRYKRSMFIVHISGLLDNHIQNHNFWNIITPYVYFHKYSKDDLDNLFSSQEQHVKTKRDKLNLKYINLTQDERESGKDKYDNDLKYLDGKEWQIKKYKNKVSITDETLSKITNSDYFKKGNNIFDIETYYEFKRVLQPPYHIREEGKEIVYTEKQLNFSKSKDEHRKIKGVAGSGKTLTLAKRAVNAHKRHNDNVLILTFNITLRRYIHDRISDVREGFNWGFFHIFNYHDLIITTLQDHDKLGKTPKGVERSDYIEKLISNINLFDDIENYIPKFKTVLIDEVQDYETNWIRIIRKYFVEKNAEMVLFGDEKQNIYERKLDKDNTSRTPNGFGRWQMLNKPIRNKQYSPMLELSKSFQQEFLSNKYEIDKYEEDKKEGGVQVQMFSIGKIFTYSHNDIPNIVQTIFNHVNKESIVSDDFVIICSRIGTLQEIDFTVRNEYKQETITTFISKELEETLYIDKNRFSEKELKRARKVQFQHHSGAIKISTIHSYKGFESPTVFLILGNLEEQVHDDNDEMVYTSITRAISNLVIFIQEGSKYTEFFSSHLQRDKLIGSKH